MNDTITFKATRSPDYWINLMKPLLALYICLTAFQVSVAAAETRPNIVFVLVDDQRNTSLSCAGHPQIKTPVIDELARQGIRFENAFVQTPICMASRANLFTGLTTTTHGYHGNPGNPVSKEDLESSFPTLLREAGYRTAFYGKQHVKWEKGVDGMKEMFDDHEVLHRNPYLKKMPDGSLRHVDEIIGDKSVAFVESQSAEEPILSVHEFQHLACGGQRSAARVSLPMARRRGRIVRGYRTDPSRTSTTRSTTLPLPIFSRSRSIGNAISGAMTRLRNIESTCGRFTECFPAWTESSVG